MSMLERALCEETVVQDMNMQNSPINQTLDSQFFPSLRLETTETRDDQRPAYTECK